MSIAALIVSVLALLVAGAAAEFSRRQAAAARSVARIEEQRHAHELADRLAIEADARQAHLRLMFRTHPTEGRQTPRHYLVVRNDGPATAEDVTVELIAATDGKASWATTDSPWPRRLHAGEEAPWKMHLLWQDAAEGMHCRLSWTDGDGMHVDQTRVYVVGE